MRRLPMIPRLWGRVRMRRNISDATDTECDGRQRHPADLGPVQRLWGGGEPAARPPTEVGVVTLRSEAVPVVTRLPGRSAVYEVAEVRPQISGIIDAAAVRGRQ